MTTVTISVTEPREFVDCETMMTAGMVAEDVWIVEIVEDTITGDDAEEPVIVDTCAFETTVGTLLKTALIVADEAVVDGRAELSEFDSDEIKTKVDATGEPLIDDVACSAEGEAAVLVPVD